MGSSCFCMYMGSSILVESYKIMIQFKYFIYFGESFDVHFIVLDQQTAHNFIGSLDLCVCVFFFSYD